MGSRRVEPVELAGAAMTVLPGGVAFLQPEDVALEAMLEGWAAQQRSRLLAATTIENRVWTVRRFVAFTNRPLAPAYRRYMERELRASFGFGGVPLDIQGR